MDFKVGHIYTLNNGDTVRIVSINPSMSIFPIEGVYVTSRLFANHIISWTKEGHYCVVPNTNGSRDIAGECSALEDLDWEAV